MEQILLSSLLSYQQLFLPSFAPAQAKTTKLKSSSYLAMTKQFFFRQESPGSSISGKSLRLRAFAMPSNLSCSRY